jgi:uncharacterized protein (TIGR02145 family)
MGWHVPTELEWATMLDKVDGDGTGTTFRNTTGYNEWQGTDAGQKLKSAATFTTTASDPGDGSWADTENRGTDDFGFGVVPVGYRDDTRFFGRGADAVHWSSSVNSSSYAWSQYFYYASAQGYRALNGRSLGFAVRCIKD